MYKYKETIKPPFSVILKKYILYYALPLLLILPIATRYVMTFVPHMPKSSGGVLNLYLHCYTGSFLFFVVPVLAFLAMVAYSTQVVTIVIKNDRLFLPIQTGDWTNGHAVTIIPLRDIISIETKWSLSYSPIEALPASQDITLSKEYSIACPGYLGDWMVVKYIRPKKSICRIFASLAENTNSFECEQIGIVFPSERSEEIKRVLKQYGSI